MSLAKELREKRAAIAVQMSDFTKEMQKPGVTPEKRNELMDKWNAADKEQGDLKTQIDMIERQDALDAELRGNGGAARSDPPGGGGDGKTPEQREADYRKLFFRGMRRGIFTKGVAGISNLEACELKQNVPSEMRAALEEFRIWKRQEMEKRDQAEGTQSISYTAGATGGYFVPAGFVYDVEIATKYYCPLADGSVIRIMDTATGNVLPYPTNNDTNEAWNVIGENVSLTDTGQTPNYSTPGTAPSGNAGNLTLSQITFGAWKGSTGLVKVSIELMQDSAFNLEDFLKEAFAIRMARGYEYFLTRGNGVNQPTGILTDTIASGVTPVIATGSSTNDGSAATGTNSIGTNDLIALEHGVDPTYRRGARYMFHDNTLKLIKQLLDKYGRPLWLPGIAANAPDTINGYPYVINQSMPTIAASANTMLFGSLQKFIMRRVKDLSILRLDERFAEVGQVAFIAFSRIDSRLVDAGTHPICYLQQHS